MTIRNFVYIDPTLGHFKSSTTADDLDINALKVRGGLDMTSQKITNLLDPTLDQDAATRKYVLDTCAALSQGLGVKEPVKAATTAAGGNINLGTGTLLTIDGVTLLADDRVLVKNQTLPRENGIYLAKSGAWVRATDANTDGELKGGTYVFVNQGTENGDTAWVITTDIPIVIGTTDIAWTQFTGISDIIAGAGLTKTGKVLAVGAGNGISVAADSIAVAARANYGINVDGNGVAMIVRANYGLLVDSNGLYIDLYGTNPSLKFTSGKLDVKLATLGTGTGGLEPSATGLQVKLSANNGLSMDASGIYVNTDEYTYGIGLTGTGKLYIKLGGSGVGAFPGLALNTVDNYGLYVKAYNSCEVTTSGVHVKCKSANELAEDASGLYVLGVPNQFKIGAFAVNTAVTATALSDICKGGGAYPPMTGYHNHLRGSGIAYVAAAPVGTDSWGAGYPMYMKANGQWGRAACDTDVRANVLGWCDTTITGSGDEFFIYGIDGVNDMADTTGFTTGDVMYLGPAAGGPFVNYAGIPAGGGSRVIQCGVMIATGTMAWSVKDFGTKP